MIAKAATSIIFLTQISEPNSYGSVHLKFQHTGGSEVQGHLHLHNKFPDTSLGYISPHLKQTNKQTQLKAEKDWEVEATEQEFKVIFNFLEILANLGYSRHYHKHK